MWPERSSTRGAAVPAGHSALVVQDTRAMLQCRQMGTWMGKQLAGWSSLEVVADATLQLDASSMCGAVGSDEVSVLFVFFIRLLRCSDDPTLRSAVSVLQSRAFTWRHPGRLGEEYEIQQGQT